MIESINGNYSIAPLEKTANNDSNNKISFSKLLKDNLDTVNDLQMKSDEITEQFALGNIDNVHDVTIASQKASTALNLTVAVQNKVMDAYNEIMRMQI
ncbi:MAG: flagellar hook-basal body complex protein FliE [Bacillota bacterium]